MAGPPMGSPRPGRVTRPTPSPWRKRIPGSELKATVATTSRPLVTSGSSPASFTTVAVPQEPASPLEDSGSERRSPSGKPISTESFAGLPSSASRAAFAAAVAQAPVVNPLLSGKNPGTSLSMALRRPCSPVTASNPAGNAGRLTAYTGTPAARAAATLSVKPPDSPLSLVRIACGFRRDMRSASSSSS